MKFVTYNIRYGHGSDGGLDLSRIAKSVEAADIVALQEVERFWKRSGMVDQPAAMAALLPDHHWVYGSFFDADASWRDANGLLNNRRRQFGTMVLSRFPILYSRQIPLPKRATHHQFNMDTGALEAAIATPQGPLRVYSLHLSALAQEERLLQIDRLLEWHGKCAHSGPAWTGAGPAGSSFGDWSNDEAPLALPEHSILAGDFNATPESREYKAVAGSIDISAARVLNRDSFAEAWEVAEDRPLEIETWWPDPPNRPPSRPLRLDYCFISAGLVARVAKVWVDRENQSSDHRPYWVSFKPE